MKAQFKRLRATAVELRKSDLSTFDRAELDGWKVQYTAYLDELRREVDAIFEPKPDAGTGKSGSPPAGAENPPAKPGAVEIVSEPGE